MKKNHLIITVIFLFLLAATVHAAAPVTVPDLETRIAATGGSIPEAALPEAVPPETPALPTLAVSTGTELPVPPLSVPPSDDFEDFTAAETVQPRDTGFLRIGGGYPFLITGEIQLRRPAAAKMPGFSVNFGYESADGYGPAEAGNGWFDRMIVLGGSVFSAQDTVSLDTDAWSAAVFVEDQTNGFQEQGPAFAIHRRAIHWDLALSRNSESLGLLANLDGESYFSQGEQLSAPGSGFESARGYALRPSATLRFGSRMFELLTSATYEFEGMAEVGSIQAVDIGLRLTTRQRLFKLTGAADFTADTRDGILVPVQLQLSTGEETSFKASLSGGLERTLSSSRHLSNSDPFVDNRSLPVYAADWFVDAGLTLPIGEPFALHTAAVWRESAYGRGIPVATDTLVSGSTREVVRLERSSLETEAGLSWIQEGLTLSAVWSSQWMDRLDRLSVQDLRLEARLRDASADRRWETGAVFGQALDILTLPRLGADGTLYLSPRISATVRFEDILCMAFVKYRMLNEQYAERSGTATLSARITF